MLDFSIVKTKIQENITPILFGALILFVVLSIISQTTGNKKQVAALIDYIETTTPYLLSQTTKIANESLISKNTAESYTTNLQEINDLRTYTLNKLNNIPKHPTSLKVENFVKLYSDFLGHIIERTDAVLLQQTTIQNLTKELENIKNSVTILTSGSAEDIKALTTDAKSVYTKVESLKADTAIYQYLTGSYFTSYDRLKILAENSATAVENVEIFDQTTRDDLLAKISSKTPLDNVLFPAVRAYQIQDNMYLNFIKQLQDQLKDIKSIYSI